MSHSNLALQNSRVNNTNPNHKSHQSKGSMMNNPGLRNEMVDQQRNMQQRPLESILTQQASQKQGNFAVMKKQVKINQDGIIKSITTQDYLSPQNANSGHNRLLPQILVMTSNPHSVGRNPQIAMGLNINKNLQSIRDQPQL